MSNYWPIVQEKEPCLRKQLLTKMFLQSLTHDEEEDFYNKSSAHETPSRDTLQLPLATGEQATVPKNKEQHVMEGNIQIEENGSKSYSGPIKKKLGILYDNGNNILTDMECNDNESNVTSAFNMMDLQDSSNLPVTCQAGTETEAELMRTCSPPTRKTKGSNKLDRRAKKIYSRILNLIEGLERRIAEFCDKENNTSTVVSTSSSNYDVPRLEYITSSDQKEKYEKYQSKTSKTWKQLEAEISLHSQYIETLETAVQLIPEDSEIHKVLLKKFKKASEFHLENPLRKEVKKLDRQCKLVGLLLERFQGKTMPCKIS